MGIFHLGTDDYTIEVRATEQIRLFRGWDVHRLSLTFEVAASDEHTVDAPFLVSGSLWATGLSGSDGWIGDLHPSQGPVSLQPFTTTFTLAASVTKETLRGLEETRAGADLALRAYLTLTGVPERGRWPSASDNVSFRIPHATWSDQVAQLD
ncbi:hypothetical protein ABZ864_29770 [Streptomyces sp. NPDC047082]|uniref:hypothetical protein n=1 Tax=Streptomyces sp. NPDC047082 TaxID=3155259 RepID=UPI0033C15A8F